MRMIRQKLKKIQKIGVLGALNGVRMRHWYRQVQTVPLDAICTRAGIPLHRVSHLNGADTELHFRRAKADLGLSLGNSYIAKRIFDTPTFGMINVHGERLPEYQNAQSVIWPIFNMERMTGITVHSIDNGIDTGPILHKEEIPIEFHQTLAQTVVHTLAITAPRIPPALRHVCENFHELRKHGRIQSGGIRYTTPSLRQYLRMRRNNAQIFGCRDGATVDRD